MPPARSSYASELKALAAKKEAAAQKAKAKQKGKNPRPNTDEVDGDPSSKKRKGNPGPATVNRKMPDERNTTQHAEPSSSAGSKPKSPANAKDQPRPTAPAGPSHNVYGSERTGRKAQEEFVKETLSEAAASQERRTSNAFPGAPQGEQGSPAEQAEETQDKSGFEPTSDDHDTDMENESSLDESESDEEEIGYDSAFLDRLKKLYRQQPTKEMKEAILAMLDRLCDAQGDKNSHSKRFNRHVRKSQNDSNWTQDPDFVITDGPRRRDHDRVVLSGYIRVVVDELLKIKNTSRLPPGPPPEVAAPTAVAFYIKWDESQTSEFNTVAARIVAKRVLKDWPTLFDMENVFEMATGHIKYLRACYRRQTIPEVAAKEPERHFSVNSRSRKHTLYQHRLKIIKAIPALSKHGKLIEHLGIDGTSSDEETARKGVYSVRRKKQLSSKVQHLKRWASLDQAYAIHFKGPGSKGNQLRRRVDAGLVSKRRFRITGLPKSCMDPTWLATLTDVQKDLLEFNKELEYDFSFPVELLEIPE
ncbi:hypothetical protein RhiJN_24159 [Ceratobasidium sp. AG-Ba]|nr:hypothetical protein RhiJN_24159 [Ceratobasidium sp. AG-Ba]